MVRRKRRVFGFGNGKGLGGGERLCSTIPIGASAYSFHIGGVLCRLRFGARVARYIPVTLE